MIWRLCLYSVQYYMQKLYQIKLHEQIRLLTIHVYFLEFYGVDDIWYPWLCQLETFTQLTVFWWNPTQYLTLCLLITWFKIFSFIDVNLFPFAFFLHGCQYTMPNIIDFLNFQVTNFCLHMFQYIKLYYYDGDSLESPSRSIIL